MCMCVWRSLFDLFVLCVPAPSAPSFIHFSELTTTSVNVSWGEPAFPNGIIEGYRLVYEPCAPVDGKPRPRPESKQASKTFLNEF